MKGHFTRLLVALSAITLLHAEPSVEDQDILHFMNGDLLHGRLVGFDQGKLMWSRSGGPAAEYLLKEIQQIAINHGQGYETLKPSHMLHLTNGDQVPGTVVSLDETALELETVFAGTLRFDRDIIKSFNRVPANGKLLYFGPFRGQAWSVVAENSAPEGEEVESAWRHEAASFYCNGVGFAQPKDFELPDDFELSFHLSARETSLFGIVFFADKAEIGDEEFRQEIRAKRSNYFDDRYNARLHGAGLMLEMMGPKASLIQIVPAEAKNEEEEVAEDPAEEQKKKPAKPEDFGKNIRIGNASEFVASSRNFDVKVTLRASREMGQVHLLVDDSLVGSWSLEPDQISSGKFLKFSQRRGRTRLSDITVSTWNRMPDSARSMESPNEDVLVFSSGTDRFSAKLQSIDKGRVQAKSRFGEMNLELDAISHLVFASQGQRVLEEKDLEPTILQLPWGGRVSGQIKASQDEAIFSALGGVELPLDFRYCQFIKFDDYDPILEEWAD